MSSRRLTLTTYRRGEEPNAFKEPYTTGKTAELKLNPTIDRLTNSTKYHELAYAICGSGTPMVKLTRKFRMTSAHLHQVDGGQGSTQSN
ncbi:hypothetical protein FHL15_004393 [Xylaria flabelliformis]|uniref:Uncharacterized protein n=1 Tax=Xylaria flabelliformis TaxID=2512241 RepID=A0A553I341_9PEZI|nr:hypothetical protein FHL15_004393 [Xylaria flabelliformis]